MREPKSPIRARLARRTLLQSAGLSAAAAPALQARSASAPGGIHYAETHAIVETAAGKVRGYSEDGIFTFKGMPYGANTAGDARFQPPAKPAAWTGVKDFLRYGPVNPGGPRRWNAYPDYMAFLFEFDNGVGDEDCLRVNVWTPQVNGGVKRPVMFWLHGGGFFGGSSQELPSYDGKNLAQRGDVVVVSINHRLAAFGGLDLTSFGGRYAGSVNVGMQDILLALHWVRDNIAAFGGDPANVTIFGQSGGGAKVNYLMTMPAAKGLFHRAIVQSATPGIHRSLSRDRAAEYATALLGELGLSKTSISQLHATPPDRLVKAAFELALKFPEDVFMPVVDGSLIPERPFEPTAPAVSASVPMLVGNTLNENLGTIGTPQSEAMTEAEMHTRVARQYPERAGQIVATFRKIYPGAKPVEILGLVLGASGYRRLSILQASRKAALNAAPAYLYTFAWKTPVFDGRLRAFHRSELPFVFDNTDRCAHQTGGGAEARRVAAIMSDAWIAFARTGNPNHRRLPHWPPFSDQKVPTMFFDTRCEVKLDHDREARQSLETA